MKQFLILVLISFLCTENFANHIRGAQISYSHVSGNEYKFTVNICAKATSPADQLEVIIDYGDGQSDTLPRISISSNPDPLLDCTYSSYEGYHTFSSSGIYTITVAEGNRIAGIMNIPGSVNEGICVTTQLTISPFFINNSVLLNSFPCPLVFCEGQLNCELLSAIDTDGDSLSFELIPCSDNECDPIGSYQYPGAFGGNFSLNQSNGEVCWDFAPIIGDYNIAVKIHEWKLLGPTGRINIGYVIADFQLKVISGCVNTVENSELQNDFKIYPNPFTNSISISSEEIMQSLQIFDLTGKFIYETKPNESQTNLELDIANGIYIIEISAGDKIFKSKISKL